MNQSPAGASDSDKALRLFQYLARLTELRSKVVMDVNSYEQVLWFNDIPQEPECDVIRGISEGSERTFWLRVRRPLQPTFPAAPEECIPWIGDAYIETPGEFPDLKSEITSLEDFEDPDEGLVKRTVVLTIEEAPQIAASWERYRPKWEAWSAAKVRATKVQSIYSKLYAIHEDSERKSEQYELIVGLGALTWKASNGLIRRHLLTIPAKVGLDVTTGHITVSPVNGSHLSFEEEMLTAQEQPQRKEVVATVTSLKELGTDIFSSRAVEDALTLWLFRAHENGVLDPDFAASSKASSKPLNSPSVAMDPALILRKRTQRSLLRMYESIGKEIEEEGAIPDNIIDLIEARGTELEPGEATNKPFTPSRTFFPLPSNAAQESIIEGLERNRGVVVQGPPGTGKSHTIANLISHLLAEGKRVLVTSHTDQALKVLRDKLPEDLAELCVGVVGAGKDGASDLEKSIIAIDREYSKNNWESNLKTLIEKSEKSLELEEEKRALLLAKARDFRRTQVEVCGYGKYRSTPSLSAALLKINEEHSWLSDEVEGESISTGALSKLRKLFQDYNDIVTEEAAKEFPSDMPDPLSFAALLREAEETQRLLPVTPSNYALKLKKLTPGDISALREMLSDLENKIYAVDNLESEWAGDLSSSVLKGSLKKVNALKRSATASFDALERLQSFAAAHVTYVDPAKLPLLISQCGLLHNYLVAGGKLKKFGRPTEGAKRSAVFLEEVTVAGNPVSTASDCANALHVLSIEAELLESLAEWEDKLNLPASPVKKRAILKEAMEELEELSDLHGIVARLNVFFAGLRLDGPAWHSREARDEISIALAELALEKTFLEKEAAVEEVITFFENARLESGASQYVQLAFQAVSMRNVEAYARVYEDILRFKSAGIDIEIRDELFNSLYLRAPQLVNDLKATFEDGIWESRINSISDAWDWKRTFTERERMLEANNSNLALSQLSACDSRIKSLVGELAKNKAWLHALKRLTPSDLQHLRAYKEALKRLGKGTGKSAVAERRNAQVHMDASQAAVPAWIMPIYRIAETLAPERHAFDVVIVDEASQSGVEALFLMWMAKKIVVVGDDKQISPEVVGLKVDGVEELQKQYLYDVPMQDNFSLKSSFFDQASVRYQGRIMLSEHFRCMPEIIEFSNRLMYNGKLLPLKQFGKDRLPPLKATYVPGAEEVKKGSQSFNEREAKAIVDAIISCVADPAYAGRSFGVISLLGPLQAQRIESMLLERLGVEEMLARNIRCGDAPGFQGDERDVIFLSMVKAPSASGARTPALGDYKNSQRFNVAASRAESQMWLFHSVTQDDLNPACVRSKLLQHMTNPEDREVAEELKGVTRNEPHPVFDSLFEQRVYLDIISKGYEVVPQWETLGRRIDLVVVGENGRLAVECDGDYWHGPEQYEADLARERDLQRVGWEFFRIRGSEYYLNEEESLLPLWSMLDAKGIMPKGWIPPVEEKVESIVEGIEAPSSAMPAVEEVAAETQAAEAAENKVQATIPNTPDVPASENCERDTSVNFKQRPSQDEQEVPDASEDEFVDDVEVEGRFTKETLDYIRQLVDPEKKKYALACAQFYVGMTDAPSEPDRPWVENVRYRVRRFQKAPAPPEAEPSKGKEGGRSAGAQQAPRRKREEADANRLSSELRERLTNETIDYIQRLINPEKKAYAIAYAAAYAGVTSMPSEPNQPWAKAVRNRVHHFQQLSSPSKSQPEESFGSGFKKRLTRRTVEYTQRLMDPERKSYALAYAQFAIGAAGKPEEPNQPWAEGVRSKIRRLQRGGA